MKPINEYGFYVFISHKLHGEKWRQEQDYKFQFPSFNK